MTHHLFRMCAAMLVIVAAGCASPGAIAPNTTTADELSRQLGKPTEVRQSPQGGEFWDYAYGPAGLETWRFHVDQGRMVRSATQLLTLERLYRVVPGQTTMEQVRDLLGSPHPRNITELPLSGETAWEWRIQMEPTASLGAYVVRFDARGIAVGIHVLMETASDGKRDNSGGGGP